MKNDRNPWMSRTSLAALAVGVGLVLSGAACDVEKVEDGRAPSLDVDADPGKLPEYEVQKTEEGRMPSVDVDGDVGELPEYDVDMPDVDVEMEERTIKVPDIDVEPADAGADDEAPEPDEQQ